MSVIPFQTPMTFLIIGRSRSGKSEFIKQMILEAEHMFEPPPSRILYCYSVWSDGYDVLEGKVDFRNDIPSNEELSDWWKQNKKETLLILDDFMHYINEEISKIFCITSHHAHVSCMVTLQNIFHPNPHLREISLNTDCFCLFKNSRSVKQIKTLASQMFDGKINYFMDSYYKAVGKQYGYLIVHLDHEYTLRTCIFSDEDTVVYLPKN